MTSIKPKHSRIQYVVEARYTINYSENSRDIKYNVAMEYTRGSGKYHSDTITISSTSAFNCCCQNICNCRNFCYANRDEKAHGQKVTEYKDRQGHEFMNTPNAEIVRDFIKMQKNFNKPITQIRLNEAGDLTREFLYKAYNLQQQFKKYESLRDIVFFTYTHNYLLYAEIEPLINKHFIVNNSYNPEVPIQKTLSNNYITVEEYIYNYTAGMPQHIRDRYNIVLCDCREKCNTNCNACMVNQGKNIIVKIH